MTDKPRDEPTANIPSESVENVEELGKGNNFLLPSIDGGTSYEPTAKQIKLEESEKTESQNAEQVNEASSTESHMVMHKGALIDVEKLIQQFNRSEKAREETELRLTELTRTYSELQSSSSKSKDKIKDLQSELKSCNRKMSDAESSLSAANVSTNFMSIENNGLRFTKKKYIYFTEKMRGLLLDSMRHS